MSRPCHNVMAGVRSPRKPNAGRPLGGVDNPPLTFRPAARPKPVCSGADGTVQSRNYSRAWLMKPFAPAPVAVEVAVSITGNLCRKQPQTLILSGFRHCDTNLSHVSRSQKTKRGYLGVSPKPTGGTKAKRSAEVRLKAHWRNL